MTAILVLLFRSPSFVVALIREDAVSAPWLARAAVATVWEKATATYGTTGQTSGLVLEHRAPVDGWTSDDDVIGNQKRPLHLRLPACRRADRGAVPLALTETQCSSMPRSPYQLRSTQVRTICSRLLWRTVRRPISTSCRNSSPVPVFAPGACGVRGTLPGAKDVRQVLREDEPSSLPRDRLNASAASGLPRRADARGGSRSRRWRDVREAYKACRASKWTPAPPTGLPACAQFRHHVPIVLFSPLVRGRHRDQVRGPARPPSAHARVRGGGCGRGTSTEWTQAHRGDCVRRGHRVHLVRVRPCP